MECKYCKHWNSPKRVNRHRDGSYDRDCIVKIGVSCGDESCGEFEPTSTFWCNVHEQRYSVEVCIGRQRSGYTDCDTCPEAEKIKLLKPKPVNNRVKRVHRRPK